MVRFRSTKGEDKIRKFYTKRRMLNLVKLSQKKNSNECCSTRRDSSNSTNGRQNNNHLC